MKRSHIFEADDGTTFDTAAACKAHEERQYLAEYLSRHIPSQILDALDRADTDLADAIERAGRIIAAKRRAALKDGEVAEKKS